MELSSSVKKILILSYISRNENPEKIPYISGNLSFLYFRKWKPEITSYILGSNFPSSKKINKTLPEKNSYILKNGTFF